MRGFEVDLQVLENAGIAITQTMRDMEARRVDNIYDDEQQYGHVGLHDGLRHFCERWQYGVEVLVEDGNTITRVLNDVVDTYIEADQAALREMHAAGSGMDPATEVADG